MQKKIYYLLKKIPGIRLKIDKFASRLSMLNSEVTKYYHRFVFRCKKKISGSLLFQYFIFSAL